MEEENKKFCTKCKIEKSLKDFGQKTCAKDGLSHRCKDCLSGDRKQRYLNNPEKAKESSKKWAERNADRKRKTSQRWASNNRDKTRAATRKWYERNKERSKEVNRIWLSKNYKKKKEYIKKWNAENTEKVKVMRERGSKKTRSTIKGRINDSFSSALYRSLKELKAGRKWEALVGYTVDQLKCHIEKQFKPGMTWDNYGKYTWHIDHIIPVSVFNYDSSECIDFKRCWSLSNLQPLEAKKNHSKHGKVIIPFQPSLLLQEVDCG